MHRQAQRPADFHRTFANDTGKVFAADIFHDDVKTAVIGLVEIEDRHHVVVIERCGKLGFLAKALDEFFVARVVGVQ